MAQTLLRLMQQWDAVLALDGTIIAHNAPSLVGTKDTNKLFLKQIGWRKILTLNTRDLYLILLPVLNSANHDIASIVIGSPKSSYTRALKVFLMKLSLIFGAVLLVVSASIAIIIKEPQQACRPRYPLRRGLL